MAITKELTLVALTVAFVDSSACPVLLSWLPLQLSLWTGFDTTNFATPSVLRLGDSCSPIGRENEGGRPRDDVVAAAPRDCEPRAQSKFANGFLKDDEGGRADDAGTVSDGGSASTSAAVALLLPGKKQLVPTEASHACGDGERSACARVRAVCVCARARACVFSCLRVQGGRGAGGRTCDQRSAALARTEVSGDLPESK